MQGMPCKETSTRQHGASGSTVSRTPVLEPEHITVLHDIVIERARAGLQKIADERHLRCCLRAPDIARLKPVSQFYTVRADGAKRYSTNLTNAVRAPIADWFVCMPRQRGRPPSYSHRNLINAFSYVPITVRRLTASIRNVFTVADDLQGAPSVGLTQGVFVPMAPVAENVLMTSSMHLCLFWSGSSSTQ